MTVRETVLAEVLSANEPVSYKTLYAAIGGSEKYLYNQLKFLVDEGLIDRVTTGDGVRWVSPTLSSKREVYPVSNAYRAACRIATHVGGIRKLKAAVGMSDNSTFGHTADLIRAAEACGYELLLVPKS